MSKSALTYPIIVLLLFLVLLALSIVWAAICGRVCSWNWLKYTLKLGLTTYVVVMGVFLYDRTRPDMAIGLKLRQWLQFLPFLREKQELDKNTLKDEIWEGSLPIEIALFVVLALLTIWTF